MDVNPDIDVEGDGKLCPQLDKWIMNSYKAVDGIKYACGEYRPSSDDKKHPLVIWLHGLGGKEEQILLLIYWQIRSLYWQTFHFRSV